MTEKAFEIVTRVDPYSDGSGYRATATVADDEGGEGPMLRIEIIHQMPISKWPDLRKAIDDMIDLAAKRAV